MWKAVNTALPVPDPVPGRPGEETTPTTPRPNTRFFPEPRPLDDPRVEDASVKTPTRNSFSGITGQRPLPASPFPPSSETSDPVSIKGELSRENSHRSTNSVDAQTVDMRHEEEDGREGSDNESVTSESNRTAKKKKGQRFFCTEFPPCKLSFTRSEHLARHIRKHTGERPFQCHCSRRFSRLDNLRQHAQTVHVNEDIPVESLAATGTRFQRQIRTDHVRPPGNRARANTLGSQGPHSRGHSRNLSTSSITSTASNMSVNLAQEARRRPQPLAMANDATARARLSLSTMDAYNPPLMGSPGPQIVDYDAQSSSVTTPTSSTFSAATESPGRWSNVLGSPMPSTGRPLSWGGVGSPGRRLSVPSGHSPFAGPAGQMSHMGNMPPSPSSAFSSQSSLFASPATPNFPQSRRESAADMDLKRRTWHPGTYSGPRPATSGLGYHQTLGDPHPIYTSQPAASQTTRLPGIESFDLPPPSLKRRAPSPMQIDVSTGRPATYHAPNDPPPTTSRHAKRASISYDSTVQRINNMEIASPNPSRERWPRYEGTGQNSANRPFTAPHPGYMTQQPPSFGQPIQAPPAAPSSASQDSPATPVRNKRQGWYNGPLAPEPSQSARAVQRTSPEDSSSSEDVPTPSNSSMSEFHPDIVHSNGDVEKHPPSTPMEEQKVVPRTSIMDRPHPIYSQYSQHNNRVSTSSSYRPQREPEMAPITFGHPLSRAGTNNMSALDTLVAVATSEQQVVGSHY